MQESGEMYLETILLLSKNKKADGIRVVTKPADASEIEGINAERQLFLSNKLDSIYAFCLEKPLASGEYMKKKPFIT